jgi:hypothetical protein
VIFSADDGNGPALWLAPPDPDYTDFFYTAARQIIKQREDGSTDASAPEEGGIKINLGRPNGGALPILNWPASKVVMDFEREKKSQPLDYYRSPKGGWNSLPLQLRMFILLMIFVLIIVATMVFTAMTGVTR